MTKTIRNFYSSGIILKEVKNKIKKLKPIGEKIDYLNFASDGEPTLDINLGITIEKLKKFGIKIAVITNSSLIYFKNIREILMLADLVLLKIDAAYASSWKQINRPYEALRLTKILEGISEFAKEFKGDLVSETMLVKGINDDIESLYKTAETIKMINPRIAYIMVPAGFPAKGRIKIPDEHKLNTAYQIFSALNINTELLLGEKPEFTLSSRKIRLDRTSFSRKEQTLPSSATDTEKELLSILAVHPMRKDAVEEFMKKADVNNGFLTSFLETKAIKEVKYNNNIYYIKNIER